MTDAGRQWLFRIDDWLMRNAGLNRADGVNQVFIRTEGDRILLIVAKVTVDFFVAGLTCDIKYFLLELSADFVIGSTSVGGAFRFNSSEIYIGPKMILI